jgi:hypothetical protein
MTVFLRRTGQRLLMTITREQLDQWRQAPSENQRLE